MTLNKMHPCVKQWNSPDSEENYNPINSGRPNYSPDEIEYHFNSMGYRCDEFSLESEFPILFMGCSFTEGEGLPMNEVWSYHIHNKIKSVTNKNIPFWSLGKGGTSIDYAARCFYEYAPQLKPKYAFYLMSGISRREYCFGKPQYQNWFPNYSKLYKPTDDFKLIMKIFCDPEFSLYQTNRSAMLLNSVAENTKTQIFVFDVNTDLIMDKNKKIELFKKYNNITYFPVTRVPGELSLDYLSKENIPEDTPEYIKQRPERARDNSHPGALWQYKIYSWIWYLTKHHFISG